MVFGEIVEPSTRALLLDDYGEYPETYQSNLEWSCLIDCPSEINTFLIVETKFAIDLAHKCFNLTEICCQCEKAGVVIYYIGSNNYVLTCNKNEVITGEIVEQLSSWIEKAKNVVALTCQSSALYQNVQNINMPISFIRSLATSNQVTHCPQLESPNIITGLGANILTYRKFIGQPCQLYIGYTDGTPLDSLNSQPFVQLFETFNLGKIEKCLLDIKIPTNNLYM